MKGLLYKDFCLIKKHCRSYMLVIIFMTIVSILNTTNQSFYMAYPCLIGGMIPVTLLSYDERSKWNEYCKTLPYSASQIVSSKYIIGLIMIGTVGLVNIIFQTIFNSFSGFLVYMTFTVFSLAISSVPLTFMFRYGVEKGRIAYYVMVGVFTSSAFVFSTLIETVGYLQINQYWISVILGIIGISLYLLLWQVSIYAYNKNKQ